jgi:hypothetical protein
MSIYVPLSQCTTNLYSSKGEYIVKSTGQEYEGPYWKYISGATFAGGTPQSILPPLRIIKPDTTYPDASQTYQYKNTFSQVVLPTPYDADPIFPLNDEGDDLAYDQVLNRSYNLLKPQPINPSLGFNPEIKTVPTNLSPLPNSKNYEASEFQRYFVKKRNENLYYETSIDYYTPLRNESKNYYWELYLVFPLKWRLTGDIEDVRSININIVNKTAKKLNLPYFNLFIKDYLKYYGGSNTPTPEAKNLDEPISFFKQQKFNVKVNKPRISTGGLGY